MIVLAVSYHEIFILTRHCSSFFSTFFEHIDAVLERELEFYFMCCSQMQTAESMSIVAGTLANGGRCPTTNERIFSPETVQSVLSVMFTCVCMILVVNFPSQWVFHQNQV